MYDASNQSQATLADCESVVGKPATLTLTGIIYRAGESGSGAYVALKVDDRWGLGTPERPFALVMDLEAFEVES